MDSARSTPARATRTRSVEVAFGPTAGAAQDPRWAAVAARDRAADGRFVYAVRSTGVYCRPSCPSRRALARNVEFFDSAPLARAAGYRACLRCRPDACDVHEVGPHEAAVVAACRALETSEAGLPLAELARAAGLSPWHFQRVFKARTGVSPKQYFKALQARRVRRALSDGARVTDAIHDAGYDSAGRFYAERGLGMRPRAWRDAGAGERIHYAIARSSLGRVLVAATGRGVCAIELGDDPAALVAALQARFARATLARGDADFRARVSGIVRAIAEPHAALELPLDVRGTAFQRRVWNALRAVPAGTTTTYAELARRIDAPRAVRAVARACASNPLAVVVPCHRVVRGDGGLAGYRWGIERKAELLRREAATGAGAAAATVAATASRPAASADRSGAKRRSASAATASRRAR